MTLAVRLVLLVALALLPPLAIQAWTGVEQRRDREADLRIQAVAQTRAVQADVARVADGVHQVLVTLATVPAIRNGDAVACTAFLLEVASQFRDYALLAATGADGNIICTSTGVAQGSYSNTGRAYFQRAMASGSFAAGDLVTGLATGRRSIHFALPFHRADGALGGLVLASVDQDRLGRQLALAALPPGALALMLDPSGTVVAAARDNRPATEDWIGQPAPETLRAALHVLEQAPIEAIGPDGRPRLFGAVPPDPELGGIVVVVALDQERALADLQEATRHNLVGILLGLLLALGAGAFGARRFILAPLARLADAADRVGRGELGARTDLGEQAGALQGVGAAFNRMSAALAAREGERDRARTAQQAGEARLARLLAPPPAGIVELDAAGRFAYANAAAERILGAGPGGLDGLTYDYPAWRPADRNGAPIPPERLPIAGALRGEPVLDYEYSVTTLDGRRKVVLADVVPVRDAEGRVEGALSAFQDVTARHDALQALRAGEERYRTLFEAIDAGFCIIEVRLDEEGRALDYRFVEVNPAFERQTGLAGVAGKWMRDLAPGHEQHWSDTYARVALTGEPVRFESGAAALGRWYDVHAFRVGDPAARRVAVLFNDISLRRHTEEMLRASEARLRLALEAGGLGDFDWDLRTDMVRPSDRAREIFAFGPEQGGHAADYYDRIPAGERDRVQADMSAGLAMGRVASAYHLQLPGGEVRYVRSHGVVVHGADGGPERMTGVFDDDTERERAEAALRQANETLEARVAARTAELTQAVDALHAEAVERAQAEEALRQSQKMEAVGQLTGGIAHDFNNMLQAISGGLEMMGRRVEQGRTAEAAGYVASAQKTVARAAALTHRLLAFARRQALQPRPVAPDELVQGMAELIGRTVGPAVAVRLDLDDGTWPVLCDPNQLENVLLNLAINARDAMPGGGTLTISTSNTRLTETDVAGQDSARPGDYVEIAVRDTGTGMDEATRARAFEPFFTTKPIGQGTGLGLSQTYGFVRQSDGAVRLDSAPGAGTAVRMYLPRHQAVAEASEQAAPQGKPDPSGVGGTVLLVEDEAEVRATVAERLREMGCTVFEAGDGAEALRLLRSCGRVDMLVTDVGLPGGLNGRQVADAAREARPGLPVLFITGYAGAALEEALAPGMAMVGKPFVLDALAVQVGAMLALDR